MDTSTIPAVVAPVWFHFKPALSVGKGKKISVDTLHLGPYLCVYIPRLLPLKFHASPAYCCTFA